MQPATLALFRSHGIMRAMKKREGSKSWAALFLQESMHFAECALAGDLVFRNESEVFDQGFFDSRVSKAGVHIGGNLLRQ